MKVEDLNIRKFVVCVEGGGMGRGASTPSTEMARIRGYAAAVLTMPHGEPEGLERAAEMGEVLGAALASRLLEHLGWCADTPLAYGKAAIVGMGGSLEMAAAFLHPRMGRPIRAAIGQGRSIIPSTAKFGVVGTSIDIPLHGADDEWDFGMIECIGASIMDAPLQNEIIVFLALSGVGRSGSGILIP